MVLKERSIVRDGNHFVYLDGAGWVLIDGPWYKAFGQWPYSKTLVIPITPELNCSVLGNNLPPDTVKIETFEWEQIRWTPGFLRGRRTISKRNLFYWMRVDEYNRGRVKVGWRVRPNGVLPATFSALTLEQACRSDYYLELATKS